MTKLSVNINKIATLRNARGGDMPSVVEAAIKLQQFGVHGITVHPRPDQRHITNKDVYDLKDVVTTEYNIEGYPSKDFIQMMHKVLPEQVTLVPDPPDVLTSNAGWLVKKNQAFLKEIMTELGSMRVSVFVEPDTCDKEDLKILRELGVQRIEMYTEEYATVYKTGDQKQIQNVIHKYKQLYLNALEVGLKINAGHDLNQENLSFFIQNLPEVSEVSIGHALISEALYEGLQVTTQNYLKILNS